MKKILNVKEVKNLPVNSLFTVRALISKFTRRVDRNNNPFWELTISDASSELDGKAWPTSIWWNTQGGDKFPIDPDNCGLTFEGSSVEVEGRIAEFRDQLQFNFNEIYYLDQTDYPPHMFRRRSPVKTEFLEASFKNLVNEIHNDELRNFINAVFFDGNLWDKFKVWPAAMLLHHAYTGGLLEHSVSVAQGASDIAKHYEAFKIPVDMDLVIAGALLHDIGKLEAYEISPRHHVTTPGNAVEHIALGYNMFMRLAEREGLNEDLTLALAHIILSHHGLREYGSPIPPGTPEALVVSAADDLDFKLSYWSAQIDALNGQSDFTDMLPLISRRFWKGIGK